MRWRRKEGDMIDVTVKVEEERLADFYAMYADWLRLAPGNEPGGDGKLSDWGPDDRQEASYVWSNMHPRAKKLFEILLSASGSVAGSELARALGPNAREDTVFGTFGPPAKLAKEVGRKHMIKSEHSSRGNTYWLDPTVRNLFERTRTELGET